MPPFEVSSTAAPLKTESIATMADKTWQSRRITIKDIARTAGVDPSTVTRALQGSSRVKPATRERITGLATEMGYVPDMAARMLVNRRSNLVGVVIPDLTNPFFADLARGIEDEAAKHDLRILIRNTEGAEAAERDAVKLFLELKVDGILAPSARCPQDYYDELHASVPVIHVNRDEARFHVSCDTVQGSIAVMEHLLGLGHRRIGFVRGPTGAGREPKMFAYRQALSDAGLDYDPELIFSFDGAMASTQATADQLAAMADRPTAMFAWNDVCAIGLMHGLRNHGIRVPDDMSVVGHDDIKLAGCVDPALTTVRWPMYELGQKSVRYLYSLRAGRKPRRPRVPDPELVIRESTAKPPPAP